VAIEECRRDPHDTSAELAARNGAHAAGSGTLLFLKFEKLVHTPKKNDQLADFAL
jgi:hypothetical protein